MESLSPIFCLSSTVSPSNTIVGDLIWVKVLGFLLVLGIIAFFIRKYNSSEYLNKKRIPGKKIFISDTCPLGNKNYLIVAQCDDDRHLIGVGPNFCQYLTKLSQSTSPSGSSQDQ